jgi:hypothetical protein
MNSKVKKSGLTALTTISSYTNAQTTGATVNVSEQEAISIQVWQRFISWIANK